MQYVYCRRYNSISLIQTPATTPYGIYMARVMRKYMRVCLGCICVERSQRTHEKKVDKYLGKKPTEQKRLQVYVAKNRTYFETNGRPYSTTYYNPYMIRYLRDVLWSLHERFTRPYRLRTVSTTHKKQGTRAKWSLDYQFSGSLQSSK